MTEVKVSDLVPETHQGRRASIVGPWPCTGTLHWNKRSQVWEMSSPRPWRKDQRPERLPRSTTHDTIRLED